MFKRLLLLAITLQSFSLIAQNFNRPVPPGVFPYDFIEYKSGLDGYILMTPMQIFKRMGHPEHIPAKPLLIDKFGFIAWYMEPHVSAGHFTYFPNVQKFGYETQNAPGETYYKILNQQFQIIDSFTNSPGNYSDAHEFMILKNGNYLISGARDSIADLSSYYFDGIQGSDSTRMIGYVIEEFDAQHNLVFYWNSNNHVDPGESYIANYGGYEPSGFDYCHGNAMEEDDDGNFLISFRHTNSIYKIDKATGNIIWILGGKANHFTFINDDGFSGQHDVRRLSNGNISLYDNGNMASGVKASRAIEYKLDTVNMTATKVWEYKYTPPFYAFAMGSFRTTTNGNRILNYGFNFRPDPSVTIIDDQDELIADIFLADSVMNYRAFMHELSFTLPRPEITCSFDNGTQILTAPAGFNKYVWSTGETTASISVTSPGVYQMWVNYGVGMLGSLPVVISTLGEGCTTVGIPESTTAEKEIDYIFDLLGRRISKPVDGQLYIIQYNDGSTSKIIWKH